MKKFLLTSSALMAAAGFASGATAAEWDTTVGGYMFAGIGLTDSDNTADGFGVMRDGEVYLNAKLTADNGITFGTVVQLEAWSQGSDQIDENYLYTEGSFGRLEIGGNDDAAYTMVSSLGAFSAAGTHFGYQDQFGITGAASGAGAGSGLIGGGVDSIGIHYFTPRFYGFQAGASYIPSTSAEGSAGDQNNFQFDDNVDESWAIAANYVGDFGDFGFDAGVGYYEREGRFGAGFDSLGFAGGVSFSGFGLRGYYDDDSRGDEWGAGLQYQTGPWTVAGGYSESNVKDVDIATGWVSYAAAPGVTLSTGIEWAERGSAEDIGGAAIIGLSF
ncbi:porin [Pikeienuella piscinae]|uniref:Porin n=2 Tax=Pikeienuella piscinae TaxID=2748098 RepID=A0A7L5BXW1_9RHOB|nr:porin [Pikeienuella piscinae]